MPMCVRCPKCVMFDALKCKSVTNQSSISVENSTSVFLLILFASPKSHFSHFNHFKSSNHLFIPTPFKKTDKFYSIIQANSST